LVKGQVTRLLLGVIPCVLTIDGALARQVAPDELVKRVTDDVLDGLIKTLQAKSEGPVKTSSDAIRN
jgi:hypothetical protein